MNIVICEDGLYWGKIIEESVLNWSVIRNVNIKCKRFQKVNELIEYMGYYKEIDIVFIDIILENEPIDGMTVAKYIRKSSNQVPIIFTASDAIRAIDGYLVEAMGFLVKPISQKRLFIFLDRIFKHNKKDSFINIVTEGRMIRLVQSDIVYAEVKDHVVTIYTLTNEISFRGTFNETMQLLDDNRFVRIHRSYLISVPQIYKIKTTYPYSVDLLSGVGRINLPVSRSHIAELLAIYSVNNLKI